LDRKPVCDIADKPVLKAEDKKSGEIFYAEQNEKYRDE
jgi:hypothetical protein